MQDSPPPAKRIKLESPPPELSPSNGDSPRGKDRGEEDVDDQCSICLQRLTDRALIPRCSHEFCFECLVTWTDRSRRCPLCAQGIGEYLIHNIRSTYDYTRYFLPPLRDDSPAPPAVGPGSLNQRRPIRERLWGQRERREQEVQDQLERSIVKRKWVYRHHLYAKHVASNVHTRYKPPPTPAQFAASSDYISRATSFLRRELQVWPNLDIEFLTTFTLSIMKSLDIRSESAVKLLSEFLDMDRPYVEGEPHPNAEHFAHEMHSYLRSPFRDLYVYDKMVQYDEPEEIPIRNRRNDTRRYNSLRRRPDENHDGNRRLVGKRKRSRSKSQDRARALRSRDPSVDEPASRKDRSGSQTLSSSSEPPSASPHPRVTKGKGKAVDLGRAANSLGRCTSGSEAERGVTIDKDVGDARIHGFPNPEHTVIGDSKRGNRDRRPKTLSLRQSVQAHLSLPKTEPLKVSGPPDEPQNTFSGPGLRHGRLSLLERISGMEEVLSSKPVSVSAAHLDAPASPYPSLPLRPAVIRPHRSARTSGNIGPTEGGTVGINDQRPDHISSISHENDVAAYADRPDRAPRVDTDDERTHVRLAEMKNVMAARIPPTARMSPPMPPVPSTPVESGGATTPTPVLENLRSKLLERLDGERKRSVGAASGELEVEPVVGNASEGSLRAELRARNRLRARLAVANGDRRVDILEP